MSFLDVEAGAGAAARSRRGPPTVGYVGLGEQGRPIAEWILSGGHPLVLWARRPASLEPFAVSPTVVVNSLAELGERSDVLGICVSTGDQVMEILEQVLPSMRAGAVIFINSTISVEACERAANSAARRQVRVVDAPVSRFDPDIAAGKFTVMVGGDRDSFELVEPVLASFGDPVRLLGPLGAGQTAKVLNNGLLFAQMALARETLDIGEALGLDPEELRVVLSRSSGRSYGLGMLNAYGDPPDERLVGLAAKDTDLLAETCASSGGPQTEVVHAARRWLEHLGRPQPFRA